MLGALARQHVPNVEYLQVLERNLHKGIISVHRRA